MHKRTNIGDVKASQRNKILKKRWCRLKTELGSKLGDGSSRSSTTGRRPLTRLDLEAVQAWGAGGTGGGHRRVSGQDESSGTCLPGPPYIAFLHSQSLGDGGHEKGGRPWATSEVVPIP